MITVIPNATGSPPCVVLFMQREGLTKIIAYTWCRQQHDAGQGLLQLPDKVVCCPTCTAAVPGSFAATSPLAVAFPAGVVTYAPTRLLHFDALVRWSEQHREGICPDCPRVPMMARAAG